MFQVHVSSGSVFSNFPDRTDMNLRIPKSLDFSVNSGYFTVGTHSGKALLYRYVLCMSLVLGPIAQLVARLTADPGVVSLITALSHIFMATDHEMISTVIFSPSICY